MMLIVMSLETLLMRLFPLLLHCQFGLPVLFELLQSLLLDPLTVEDLPHSIHHIFDDTVLKSLCLSLRRCHFPFLYKMNYN